MAKEEEKRFGIDPEERILFSLMGGDREGIPGLRGSVSKRTEQVNARQVQETV